MTILDMLPANNPANSGKLGLLINCLGAGTTLRPPQTCLYPHMRRSDGCGGGKCLRPVTVATPVNPVRVLTRFRKSGKFRPKTSKVQVKHEKSPSN
jgi:hypothetical protein